VVNCDGLFTVPKSTLGRRRGERDRQSLEAARRRAPHPAARSRRFYVAMTFRKRPDDPGMR